MEWDRAASRIASAFLSPLGLELRRRNKRSTMVDALQHVRHLGFSPRTVLDVGAASGTPPLYQTFPDSRHVLIEPLEEFRPALERTARRLARCELIFAAASARSGARSLNVHADLVGSSLYSESEGPATDGVARDVPTVTLDELLIERGWQGPFLLKVDVQGAELDVLAGATTFLEDAQYVILETVLFAFFSGGPQFVDVVAFMKDKGFVPYEFFDPGFRLLDDAMSQIDVAFVKEDGRFRREHVYATARQREEQNRRFARRAR